MSARVKYLIVDKKIIPKSIRTSKYTELLEHAKKLEGTQVIQITEEKGLSLTSISSLMSKNNLKVARRIMNGKKTLFIAKE